MSKLDIKDAFRLIPINPKDYELLGIHWDSKFYFDKTLPMGCSTSCAIFEALSSAIHWSLTQKIKDGQIVHIIDDPPNHVFWFLFVSYYCCEHKRCKNRI